MIGFVCKYERALFWGFALAYCLAFWGVAGSWVYHLIRRWCMRGYASLRELCVRLDVHGSELRVILEEYAECLAASGKYDDSTVETLRVHALHIDAMLAGVAA